MIPALSVENLLSWAAQVLALASIGALLPFIFRIRHPRSHLAYCYALLAACLVLPFIGTWQHPVVPAATGVPVQFSATPTTPLPMRGGPIVSWQQLVFGLLLAGIALRLGWLIIGLWQIRGYRSSATPLFPVPQAVLTARMLTGRHTELGLSPANIGPVTFGLWRPLILLPESFQTMSAEAQCAIVCHELLHVRRRDWLATVIEELVGAALWFHPAVWWLLNQTKLAREQVVDAEVVRLTGQPESYIQALLSMSGADHAVAPVGAPAFLRKRHLALRMHSLLTEVTMSRSRLLLSYVSMTCVLVAAGWLTLTAFPLIGQPQIQEASAPDGAGISVDAGGDILHRTPIFYPFEARQNHVEGSVIVGLSLNAKGEVIDAHVMSGPDDLRKDVLQAVLQWHYVADATPSRSVQARIDFHAPTAPPQYSESTAFYATGGKELIETIDVSDLPEPMRSDIWQRVQGFKGQPFSPALMNQLQNAVSGADSHLRERWGVTQDGNRTLKFVLSQAVAEDPPLRLSIKTSAQESAQDSALDRKVRSQSAGRGAYVITDDERAAYQRLTTDEEREYFIEQFWQRRQSTTAPAAAEDVVAFQSGSMTAPRILSKVDPQYSEEARAARYQGTVVLQVIVRKDGTVQVVRVVRSLGMGLDEQATLALQQWHFEPAKQNGVPVAVSLNVEVNFNFR